MLLDPYIEAYERLLKKIKENEHGCWIWTGATRAQGRYGMIRMRFESGWGAISTHKLAYVYHNGLLLPKHVVRHGCDVTLCCFHKHLVSGTSNENMGDMIARGRGKNQFQPKRQYDGRPHESVPF